MMKARLTYIPIEVADQFEDFIIKRDEQILDAVKARTRDYSTLSLLKYDAMWFDYSIMIVFSVALLIVMKTGFRINRIEGLVLISGYIAYAIFLFLK